MHFSAPFIPKIKEVIDFFVAQNMDDDICCHQDDKGIPIPSPDPVNTFVSI